MIKHNGTKKSFFKKFLKTMICKCILSPVYYFSCIHKVNNELVVLADGHQSSMPHSMMMIKKELEALPNIEVVEYYHNYSFGNPLHGIIKMIRFMPLYASARYVFISDSFIPVSACKKRRGTTVVQLWHSSGLMKKIGYDSPQEAGNLFSLQYRNYDVFTVSSSIVGDTLSQAMHLPRDAFVNSGTTLLDFNYRDDLIENFKKDFYDNYPQYIGKKIILWAPTFRGTPKEGYLVGLDSILRLKKDLPDNYEVIIKTHRYSKNKEYDTDIAYCADFLIHIADVFITDYSSIYYDFLSKKMPIVLFCPDLERYKVERGLYIDYNNLPGKQVSTYDDLLEAITNTSVWANDEYLSKIDELWKQQMNLCDGHSCEKLLKLLHLK